MDSYHHAPPRTARAGKKEAEQARKIREKRERMERGGRPVSGGSEGSAAEGRTAEGEGNEDEAEAEAKANQPWRNGKRRPITGWAPDFETDEERIARLKAHLEDEVRGRENRAVSGP